MFYNSLKNFCSSFPLLSLVHFLHVQWLLEQFWEPQVAFGTTYNVRGGIWKPVQTSWKLLLEEFLKISSLFQKSELNFFLILPPKCQQNMWKPSPLVYNDFDLFLENKDYRPFDGCKIEIWDTFTTYVFLIFWAVFCAFGFKVWKKYYYDF